MSIPKSSENTGTDECLDLSRKRFVFVYFKVRDPGHEYEIFSEKDIIDRFPGCDPEIGSTVTLDLGLARTQATVLSVSSDRELLQRNWGYFVETHQQIIMNVDTKIVSKEKYILNETGKSEREVNGKPRTCDNETQTDFLSIDHTELQKVNEYITMQSEKIRTCVNNLKEYTDRSFLKANFKMSDNTSTESPSPSSSSSNDENKENVPAIGEMVQIGFNGTKIPKHIYDSINWSRYTSATRKLLVTLFTREVLASHSLTGKPSPAFLGSDKQTKARLNPVIVADIVEIVSRGCKVSESVVRAAITTKCADENKLRKTRIAKGRQKRKPAV